jgi:hypothetical protein
LWPEVIWKTAWLDGRCRLARRAPAGLVGDRLAVYRARELAPYRRRDAGLYDSGLTDRVLAVVVWRASPTER